jgi:phage-related minor tail protein
MGRSRNIVRAETHFNTLLGRARGLSETEEQEAVERRKTPAERAREADERRQKELNAALLRKQQEIESAQTRQRQEIVDRIRTTFLALLDEKEEWDPQELRAAAKERLPASDHNWVSGVLMSMSGDGGEFKPTPRWRVRRAPDLTAD